MPKKKRADKKVVKHKPRHPRPDKNIRWAEKKEAKPAYKKKRKKEKEIEKDLLNK